MTDEQTVISGERIRSWDSCMFTHFTPEASGHNPRAQRKWQRLKNRIGHKFIWLPRELRRAGMHRLRQVHPLLSRSVWRSAGSWRAWRSRKGSCSGRIREGATCSIITRICPISPRSST